MLEFLNACESFTLVLTKLLDTEQRRSRKKRRDAVVNPYHFTDAQSCLSKEEETVWWVTRRIRGCHNPKHVLEIEETLCRLES